MHVTEAKKHEYWNHFVAQALTGEHHKPPGVTGPRLRQLKLKLWRNKDFWWDIVSRHGGDKVTPEEMWRNDRNQYDHCLGNFWSMIVEDLHKQGFRV